VLPPRIPETSQLTAVFVVPETVALNCCDWLTCKLTFVGEIATVTAAGMTETVASPVAVD
jgi:hypothetical protein